MYTSTPIQKPRATRSGKREDNSQCTYTNTTIQRPHTTRSGKKVHNVQCTL